MTITTGNCSPITRLVIERRNPSPYKLSHLLVSEYFEEIATGFDGDYQVIPENQLDRSGKIEIHIKNASHRDWYNQIPDGLENYFNLQISEVRDKENWKGEFIGKVYIVENL